MARDVVFNEKQYYFKLREVQINEEENCENEKREQYEEPEEENLIKEATEKVELSEENGEKQDVYKIRKK